MQERGLVCSKGLGGLKGSVWSKGGPSQASCEWATDSRMRREHAGSREWAGGLCVWGSVEMEGGRLTGRKRLWPVHWVGPGGGPGWHAQR